MLSDGAPLPILQFGTSRFLQAHVDLFVSEAMDTGQALGGIVVVQTTSNPQSARRVQALSRGEPYPVRIRGLSGGVRIDETRSGRAIRAAWQAQTDWPRVIEAAIAAQVIVSNTGDKGYLLDAGDDASLLRPGARVPASFPAKLLALLHARWQHDPAAPLTLLPCELIARNGDTLRDELVALASGWSAPADFVAWLRGHCVWANSLVDRIVSEALYPIGAIAEPYALWAVERQPHLVMPCVHPCIVLTDELAGFEQLKLYLLNLGHTFLAERWRQLQRPADETVVQIMADPARSGELEALWAEEVLPVFDALGRGDAARAYLEVLRERLRNPFLAHRVADIADNRVQKIQRRFGPVVALAEQHGLRIPQTRLRAALAEAR
jgi:tagaturonate reductase